MRFNEDFGSDIAITYDDVCLVPQYSEIQSRSDVDLSGGSLKLKTPLISANMDSVTEAKMAIEMATYGGLGIIHRFMDFESLTNEVNEFYNTIPNAYNHLALSLGVSQDSYDMLDYCLENAKIICIDIAHGHSKRVLDLIREIRRRSSYTTIIAGNVATADATKSLLDAGANIIKCGVGPGSMCTTRVVTGHGVPQLTVIDKCSGIARSYNAEIIADGGIRNSGDIAKAIAAGAHYVMLGSLLAGTDESPGKVLFVDGSPYKEYRGMASFNAQKSIGKDEKKIVPEGASKLKKCKGPAKDIIFQLSGGLRSALSYSGSSNLNEFRQKAEFVRITSASRAEGEPHGLVEN